MTSIRKITHFLLTYILCLSMVLLPVPLARADFTNSGGGFTIWMDAGRAAHDFQIQSPNGEFLVQMPSPIFDQQAGRFGLTGSANAGQDLVIRDNTTGDMASLPNDANGETTISGANWNPETGDIHTLYVPISYDRSEHALVLSQNGSFYVPSSTGRTISGFLAAGDWDIY